MLRLYPAPRPRMRERGAFFAQGVPGACGIGAAPDEKTAPRLPGRRHLIGLLLRGISLAA